jgi:FtsP/CotA-like multicopper oxidase with cupredoxin domain
MKKKLLPVLTAVALLAMPVGQAVAANKPAPPASSSGGKMHMSASQMSAAQPAMSGWDMVKMRTTAKMRAKAARNAHLKGKPAQAVAATTFDAGKGPDYFGTTPNYASSSMPRITWKTAAGTHGAGANVILPVFDPTTGILTDAADGVTTYAPCSADSPFLSVGVPARAGADMPTCATPTQGGGTMKVFIDPVNKIPQLDLAKVNIAGGIRKFVEPLPGLAAPATGSTMKTYGATTAVPSAPAADATTSYIPVAIPDTTTYPDADYYEIGLKEYFQTFSPDLPPTKLRGYYQMNTKDSAGATLTDAAGKPVPGRPFYLGPIIQASKDRAVRIKFVNQLPTGAGGDLFLPTDTTAMGAGAGPDGGSYSQNRAVIHLHGGLTPWISDGTPNQWTTPAGENTQYPKGVSVYGVPDMPAVTSSTNVAGNDGSLTFYYTNKQSARLMWYHDHAYGLTRLNVYAGEVSGYVLTDPKEQALTATTQTVPNPAFVLPCLDANGVPSAAPVSPGVCTPNPADLGAPATIQQPITPVIPGGEGIPLVIQDKAFVPDDIPSGYFPDGQLTDQDPTWNRAKWGGPAAGAASDGSLWFPHVYMPNQNPYDNSGANAMGRWDYGPWFWPIFGTSAGLVHGEVANPYANAKAPWEPPFIPGTPSTYTNGTATKGIPPTIPNPLADPANPKYDAQAPLTIPNPEWSPSDVSLAPEAFVDTPIVNGVAYPYMNVDAKAYRFRILNGANDRYWNLQMYCSAADKPNTGGLYKVANTAPMWANVADRIPANPAAGEVPMVPAVQTDGYPADWPTDGRSGGVPDPASRAGDFLQIGSEGGVLPNAVDVPNQPVNYVYNRRDIIVLSISTHALLLGPAERADVVYDFSTAASMGCKNVVMYNDSPTPVPAFDPRNDYYTNNPDQTDSGGTPSTLPGYGPNTRTIMQFRIQGAPVTPAFDSAKLITAVPKLFRESQNKPIIPEKRYAAAWPGDPISASDVYSRIQSTNLSFNVSEVGQGNSLALANPGAGYAPIVTITRDSRDVQRPGDPLQVPATAVPVIGANGTIAGITVVNPGVDYRYTPTVTVSTPVARPVGISATPVTATATAVRSTAQATRNTITRITMVNKGVGYSSGADLTIDPPVSQAGGVQATGTATVDMNTGQVSAVTLTSPGGGYTGIPNVTISKPLYVLPVGVNGQATATASVSTSAVKNVTMNAEPKAIQELFEMDYGRMNATLGVELPFTNSLNQTTLPMGYTEPTTEFLKPSDLQGATQIGSAKDGTAIWKITHNGVDTHTIHFHLMDVQLINRVGWDGAIRPPDDNELGWKESVRMNPLEDAIVAMRPVIPELPFKISDSIRSIDPTMPANHDMTAFDPLTGQVITFSNAPVNMGWEYVWHCHLLGHEENDMMRPVDFHGSPDAPLGVTAAAGATTGVTVHVRYGNGSGREWQTTNYVVQRTSEFTTSTSTVNNVTTTIDTPDWSNAIQTQSDKGSANGAKRNWQGTSATLGLTSIDPETFEDSTVASRSKYFYRVRAEGAQGYSQWSSYDEVTAP